MKKFALVTMAVFMFSFGLFASYSDASAAQGKYASQTVEYSKIKYPSWQNTPSQINYYESINAGGAAYAGKIDRVYCKTSFSGNTWECYYKGFVPLYN
ncbi:hypothetical protein IC620_16855 [Hazenella sp. IB182357]|uniref:Uncharacterized protein n=1 Tax=Polycladospora coralii TaxID=2771432 RepID=A0A926RUJ3_9BACL|nr:hypothetical protein [Polycladospora coralii]MBD1374010.1 hypothetical protein [Polycladospora coralii]MBS7531864.1 hypothetical protein [Polycladospora coralii]